jgi:hypothetical protein
VNELDLELYICCQPMIYYVLQQILVKKIGDLCHYVFYIFFLNMKIMSLGILLIDQNKPMIIFLERLCLT